MPARRDPTADALAAVNPARLALIARLAAGLLAGRALHPAGPLGQPRAAAGGAEFLEHQAFSPGDDPRAIDWRASARRRTPVVRRWRDERAGEWLVALDRSASMGAAPGVWPLAVQLAAAAGFVLMQLGHRVLLALFSDTVDGLSGPARGDAGWLAQYRRLAAARPTGLGSAPEVLAPLLTAGRRPLLISDALRPDALGPALARLSAAGQGLELIRVSADPGALALPGGPTWRLVDAESGAARLVPAAAAALAMANAARLSARLAEHGRRLGVVLTSATPADPWERVLLAHLSRRRR